MQLVLSEKLFNENFHDLHDQYSGDIAWLYFLHAQPKIDIFPCGFSLVVVRYECGMKTNISKMSLLLFLV